MCTLPLQKSGYPERVLNLIENPGDRVIFRPERLDNRDQTFERVLALYPDMRVEMDEAGNISLMAPGSFLSGLESGEVFGQLREWTKKDGTGRAADASTIYNLPNGAKMSPEASWVPKSVVGIAGKAGLSTVTGAVITPVFIAEVRSPSDRLPDQKKKCERWIKAGVQEAWLVDPIERKVHIFRSGRDVEVFVSPKQVKSTVLKGFILKCGPVWDE